MRVAALYDIHANLPALEAVLAEVERESVDVIVVGGDVATGPFPRACLERLRARPEDVRYLRGNADRLLAEGDERHGGGWCARQLSPDTVAELATWPATITLDVDGLGATLFCHATPRSDEEIVTLVSSDQRLREALAGVRERVVVAGHTHAQADRRVDGTRFVNAGSVGLPYEGRAGAYWAVLGPDVDLRRTEYDVEAAARQLAATGFPEVHDLLAASLLDPRPREEIAAYFEQQARGS